jgi:hypothetical protein
VTGDFVVLAGADAEKVVKALEKIIFNVEELPVSLAVQKFERDVYVLSGKYEAKPLADRKKDQIEVYARDLIDRNTGGGGSGSLQRMAGSPEYFQIRTDGTAEIFLLYLYLDALKREPDGGAEAAFSQALAAGITRTQVATVVFGSSEYKADLVQGYYQQFLHRTAAAAELNPWVSALLEGARDEQVIAGILSSDEYFARSQ